MGTAADEATIIRKFLQDELPSLINGGGGGGDSPQLGSILAELRYLNNGLFGSTAETPATPAPAGLWAATFYRALSNESVARPLAELIVNSLYTNGPDFGGTVRDLPLAYYMRNQLGNLVDDRVQQRLAQLSNRLTDLYNELRSVPGQPSTGLNLQDTRVKINEALAVLREIETNTEPVP